MLKILVQHLLLWPNQKILSERFFFLNSASNFDISIGETVKLISELMNISIEVESEVERMRPINSEVNRLYGSNQKILSVTDWEPEFKGIDFLKKA